MMETGRTETTVTLSRSQTRVTLGLASVVAIALVAGTWTAAQTLYQLRNDINQMQHTLDYVVERTAVSITRSQQNKERLNGHDTKLEVIEERIDWFNRD